VIIQECGVQVVIEATSINGERKGRIKFFEKRFRESVWSG